MEFMETTATPVVFYNRELQRVTDKVYKLGETIKKNWFEIAHIVAYVDMVGCYTDDGFKTVHEWTEKAFGLKKSASYSLLTIGREYTREIVNASGKVVGYGTNLVANGQDDFSKTQVEKMLPAGHKLASELVDGGEITPNMSAIEISRVVKSHVSQKPDDSDGTEQEPLQETMQDVEIISVWDKEGKEYKIPVHVLMKYDI